MTAATPSLFSRWRFALITAGLVLAVLGLGAWVLTQRLHAALEAALGPQARVGRIEARLNQVVIHDLVISAKPSGGWPGAEEGRATRITLTPDLRSIWPGQPWRLHDLQVHGGRLTLLRNRDGKLVLLPSLLEGRKPREPKADKPDAAAPKTLLLIGEATLRDCDVDYYDASLNRSGAAHHLQLAGVQATVGPLALPTLDRPIHLQAQGRFVGPTREGQITLSGTLDVPLREGKLQGSLKDVDLIALQPYVFKNGDGAVKRGTLNLEFQATLNRGALDAPGHISLSNLELGDNANGVLGAITGVSRQAVLAAMARDGKIDIKFKLQGRVDDPKFSLNESIAARFGAGLAESLGMSVGQVVQGVGGVIKGLLGK